MNYITLDLEWNQAYAQQSEFVQKKLGSRLRGEIIQIGAVKLNEDFIPIGSFSTIVRPEHFRKIQRYIRELTGITQYMVENAETLPVACRRFQKWCGNDYVFLTWGPDDIPMLEDNLRIHDLSYDWIPNSYDLQPIFNMQTDGSSGQKSLEYAMEYLHVEQSLPAHDALNDAYFTALVAQKLDIPNGIKNYPKETGPHLLDLEIGNSDIGEKGFESVEDIFLVNEVKEPLCPICQSKMSIESKVLHSKGQKYTTLFQCREHGDYFRTLKIHKNLNDTYRARMQITKTNEEEIKVFHEKLKESLLASANYKKAHSQKKKKPVEKQ